MTVLYRKYRPTKLADVVGQPQVTTVLENSLKQNKLAHAYLFVGPRGTGKTSVARIFAHAVNQFDYQIEDSYLDIIEIDAASNTGVDNIRELREKAIIAPTTGKYKVYIIDEVHMLTKSASNALLKTLEEPPEHVIFIMATTDAHKVPITISSRTQVHTFKLADPATMRQHLRQIADTEGINIDDAALDIITRRGGGSFRDSLSLLDQISNLADGPVTADLLESALGLPQEDTLKELLRAAAKSDMVTVSAKLQDLINTGIKPELIASELINLIIRTPEPQFLPLLAKLPEVQPPFAEAKLLLACIPTEATAPEPAKAPAKSNPLSHPTPTPKPAKTPPVRPQDQVTSKAPAKTSPDPGQNSFDWEAFVAAIQEQNIAVYNQLLKVNHEIKQGTLHLYPDKKFVQNILEKPGNRQILSDHLSGLALIVHDPEDRPRPEAAQFSQISAIMGGIQEVGNDTPF